MKKTTLAKGWREVRLGEVCTFQKGKGLSKKEIRSNGKRPCILYGELFTKYSGRIKAVISRTDNIRGKFLSKRGDILMPSSDVTPNGLATASILYEDGIILGGDIIVIRSIKGEMDSLFFSFYVKANKQAILKLASGVTVFHIYKSDLSKLKIPLPPLPEQRAIAALLETWDTAIGKTEALIATKQRQFEWLMASLIINSKEHNYELSQLQELAQISKGEQLNRTKLKKTGKHPAWNGGIIPSGYTDKWNVAENTITISEGGSCGFVNYCKEKFWCGGHCYALTRIDKCIETEYLYYFLKAYEKRIMRLRVGSGLLNIRRSDIEKFAIKYPSIQTQRAITKTLNTAQQEITLLKQLAEQYCVQKHGLMQGLLTGKWRIQI